MDDKIKDDKVNVDKVKVINIATLYNVCNKMITQLKNNKNTFSSYGAYIIAIKQVNHYNIIKAGLDIYYAYTT